MSEFKLKRFAGETTVHGITYAVNSKNKSERCVWVLAILLAIGMAFALTANIWIKFIQGELGTKNVALDPRDKTFMEQEFPLVYCPSNWIDPFKVVKMMKQYNVSFSGIQYALHLMLVEEESYYVLRRQLLMITTDYVPGVDLEDPDERLTAQTEFAKLPQTSLQDFVEAVSMDFGLTETLLQGRTVRYGRNCMQLQSNNTELYQPQKLTYGIGLPQLNFAGARHQILMSPIVGDLSHFHQANLDNLNSTVGTSSFSGYTRLHTSSIVNHDRGTTVQTQLSVRAFIHEYIRNCNHTEYSGIGRMNFPQMHCEEACMLTSLKELSESKFNCSMSPDWSAWKLALASGSDNASTPCNLYDEWYSSSRDEIGSSVYAASDQCMSACLQYDCVDNYRKLESHADQVRSYEEFDQTLLQYALIRNGHTTPLGSFNVSIGLNLDIDEDDGELNGPKLYHNWGEAYLDFVLVDAIPTPLTVEGELLCDNQRGTLGVFISKDLGQHRYRHNSFCFHRFEAPENHVVKLKMITAAIEYRYDYLNCFDGDELSYDSAIGTFTGCTQDRRECDSADYVNKVVAYSITNVVVCYFFADYGKKYFGYVLQLEAVPHLGGSGDSETWVETLESIQNNRSSHIDHFVTLNVAQFVKTIEYELVDWIDLLSGVGGVLSLFVGCSILSITHIFWFGCHSAWSRKMGRK